MAKCDRLTVQDVVYGYLATAELEAKAQLADARAFLKIEESAYTTNRVKGCQHYLTAVRAIRHRLPKTWRRYFIEDQPHDCQ